MLTDTEGQNNKQGILFSSRGRSATRRAAATSALSTKEKENTNYSEKKKLDLLSS